MVSVKRSLIYRMIISMFNWVRLRNEIRVCRHYYQILKSVSNRPRVPDSVNEWRSTDNLKKRKDVELLRARLEMQTRIEKIAQSGRAN